MAPIASPSARRILADGIEFLVVMVGAYGVGEVLTRLETGFATKPLDKISNARTELPTLKELNDIKGMFLRSSVVGDLIGLVAGRGRDDRVVRQLRHRGALRPPQESDGHRHCGRHRCAAGGGDRVGRRRDGSPAGARHSRQRRDRDHPRRLHAARHPAGAAGAGELVAARLHRVCLAFPRPRSDVRDRLFRHPAAGEDPRFARSDRIGLRADPLLHRRPLDPQQHHRSLADHRFRHIGLSGSNG